MLVSSKQTKLGLGMISRLKQDCQLMCLVRSCL